jgi:hypothetical protein
VATTGNARTTIAPGALNPDLDARVVHHVTGLRLISARLSSEGILSQASAVNKHLLSFK